jgi:hypothetical protein
MSGSGSSDLEPSGYQIKGQRAPPSSRNDMMEARSQHAGFPQA